MRRLAITTLVLVLLGGTAAAFAVAEALKLDRSPIADVRVDRAFSPTCGCETNVADISFTLRRSDRLDLTIVSGDTPVRTLASDVAHEAGPVVVDWDGRDDSGAVVPDGAYRLRVDLADEGRTVDIPKDIVVDTVAPEIEVVDAGPTVISPDGDGRRDKVRIAYRVTEDASAHILVDHRIVVQNRVRPERERTLGWRGRLEDRSVPEGMYTLSVQARDRAGNVSAVVGALTVEVRYVAVVPAALVARRGGRLRFRILSDAASVSWRLRDRGGRSVLAGSVARPGHVAARLPARIRPGRYVLTVVANGHAERTAVRILPRAVLLAGARAG